MPLTLKDFRASYPQYDDVPDDDLVQSLHQKFYADIPLAEFAKSIEAPVPTATAGDYGRALMSGFANLAEAGGKGLSYVPGLEEVGQSIQETGKEAADYWRESMTPAGQAAMSNEIITDEFSLGETPLQSIGLQAMASAPSMLGAAIPGAGAVGVLGKIGGKTLQELAKHPGAIGFLAKYGPSATAFGASEGAIAALQNASQTEYEIRNTPIDKLRAESPSFQRFYAETDPNLPPEQRDAMAQDATAKAAADDVALKTFFSTGGIGIATGGGAMGWLQRMFGKEAAKEAAKKGFIRMVGEGAGTEFVQETPQSGAEQYIQRKAMQEHVDPTIDPQKGVTSAALSGGIVGAALGGAGGAGGYVVRPRDPERDIALKVASAQTVDEAIAAATAAAEGAPATGILNNILGGHASGVSIPQVIEGGAMGVSGAETLEPTYGQTLAQVGEGMYEPRQPAPAATTPAQDRRLPVVQPPRVIVTPEGQAATETQLARQQAQQAERDRQLGITPDIRQQIQKTEPAPKAPTVDDIHALAEKKHIAYDNDPDFMDFTESVTGKRHLDALNESELQALHQKLAARPDQEHKYSSSQVAVKGDISVKLRQAAKKLIAAEDVDPTEGLEKRPHITLKYGLRTADAAQLEQVLAGEGPITATIGDIEIFEPENEAYDVVVARVESPELTRLNQKVSAAIPNVDTHPEYKPHVTLGYVKKGTGKKYAQAKTGLEGKTLTFNAVEFSSRDGKITPIELKVAESRNKNEPTSSITQSGTPTDESPKTTESADQPSTETTDNLTPLLDQIYDHDKSSPEINKRATEIKDSVPSKMTEEEARAKLTEILDRLTAAPEAETPPQAPETEPKQPESTSAKAEKVRRAIERQMYTDALENSEIIEEAKTSMGEGDSSSALSRFKKNADQIVRSMLQKEQSEAIKTKQADRAAAIGKILKDGMPDEFYESVYKATKKAIKQAEKDAARDPAAYDKALTSAALADGIAGEDLKTYRQGFDHAIAGKTKSTLPSGATLDAGYKAAQKWLKTDEGRNYYEGKRGQKLENTGVALRRWFDGAKKRLSDVEGVDELIKEVEASTSRAEMFANVAGEGATPGTIRYLGNLANDIAPFKEWLTTHGPLNSLWGEYTKRRSTSERLLNYLNSKMYRNDKKTETTAERIAVVKEAAQTYLDTLGELVNALQGVKNVKEAADRYEKLFVVSKSAEPGRDWKFEPTKFRKTFENFWRSRYSVWVEYTASSWKTVDLIGKENDPNLNADNRKKSLTPPRLDRVVREGLKDHRKGKDVTPKQFKKAFGFKDVGFGKWVGTRQDQDHLNYAYDAFMDLAELLGIKPTDISLGGTLYFTIGALGHGKFAAHFQPEQPHPDGGTVPVINVTNTRGDGTLAHEWHHALDFHLRKASGNSPSIVPHIVKEMKTRYDYDRVRNGVERMLREGSWFTTMKKEGPLKNAYYAITYYADRGESKYKEEANKLDGNAREQSKLYWSNNEELFARAAEAYVLDKLDGTNNYLVNPEWVGDGKVKPPMYRGTPYPEGDERKRFAEWFDAMYKSLDWTDAGPVLNKEKIRENMPKHRAEYDKALADLRAEIPEMKALIDAEDRAKVLTIEQEAAQKLREEQDRIRAELEAQKAPPPPVGELNDDEIAAAFDQAAAELQESTHEKPDAPEPGDATSAKALLSGREGKLPSQSEKTAARLATDAAKLGVKGIDEALKGLVELFGGGKIKSFPAGFDEEAYQKAKPHFEAALKAFQDAGKTLVDLFKFLIEKFGLGIRPYAERFAKDQKLSMGLANAPSASRQVANWVRDQLQAGNDIRWQDLFDQSDKAFGGTQAEGKYTSKDAYDAMEAGVNMYLLGTFTFTPIGDVDMAVQDIKNLSRLLDQLPSQTKRTEEMDEYQQFSTPPPLAYAASWAANIRRGESMLEPSAGIGGIAIFADLAGARVTLNELSSRRAAVLKEVLPNARLFQENAEQLHNLLPDEIKPTVIVMNPPFSSTAGRMEGTRKTAVGAQHIEQALKRLAPKGRLVAIVGEGMGADKSGFREWWGKIKADYNVRANVGMSGKNYAKYGTTFDNQLLVIDKTGPTKGDIVTGKVDTIEELIKLVEGVRNDRPATDQAGEPVTAQPGGSAVPDAGVAGEAGGAARSDADALGAGERPGDQTATPGTPDTGKGGGAAEPSRADQAKQGDQVPDRGGRGGRPGRRGAGKAEEPGGGGEPAATDTAQQYDSAVKLGQAEKQKAEGELTEAIFEDYKPQRLKIEGAKPHPGKLVQSAAMAAVEPPAPTYTPNLPREVITKGMLSLAQIEAVVYAGQAHEQFLPDGSRRGFFIGDGTGVGKGREIAGIILDNLRQGRKKAIWISEKRGLFKDAGRDFEGVGGDKTILFQQHKFPAVGKISPKGGIMFSTYSMLRGGEKKQATDTDKTPGKTRVAQIVEWLGSEFDGVIVFDEAHNMANAVQKKGERGKSDPSKQAMAGLELQKLLPKARVVYVSATGATEVSNLVYAQRLGLWGEGTAFSGSTDFVTKVDAGGVAAMELVARDLKALGSYIARSLSFEGVTYERLEHELTSLQTDVYNKLAEAWQIVLKNVNQALEATLQGKNGRAKSAAMSRFWSTEQRFFNQVITSMQMPTIIEDARKHLDDGKAVVLQLVNTNEAEQERQVARAEQENIEIEELDFTPRQSLMDYVRNGFPVQQYEEYTDEEGNKQTRPVMDSQGNPVINKEMVEKRDALLKELEAIQVPDNPIDIILETFGPKMVGEVTGRSRRFIRQRGKDGEFKMVEEKRSASSAQEDAQAFMDDKKRVLIFSDAGGTGYSFHADNTQQNQRRRHHYLVQPGWRADKAVQGFGRTHRTNEASQPHYVLPTTSLKAQKRFISSIARRLDQLGALTKGQRQTGSQGLFNAADNLESKYASEAMQTFFEDLYANRTPLNTDETIGMMGLENLIDPKTGALNETKIPTVPKFLNRLLALDTEMQNQVFDEFFSRMEELVHNAIQKGTYDQGVETLKALKVHKLRDEVAYTDKRTGAETHYVELELTLPTEFHEWDEVQNRADLAKKDFAGYFLNNKTGKVFAMLHRGTRTGANGQLLKRAVQIHVAGSPRYIDNAGDIEAEHQRPVFAPDSKPDDKGKPHYQKLDPAQAKEVWEKERKESPQTHTKTVHLISGAILPIWDRVTGQPKVIRTQTDEGERLLGRVVSDDDLKATLRNLGIGSSASKMSAAQILTRIERGDTALLANGWQIRQVRVADDTRLEITAASFTAGDQRLLKEQGAFIERINWRERVFIPTGDQAEAVLDRIIKNKPVVEIISKSGAAEFSLSEGEFSSLAARLAPKPETIAYAEEETEATRDLRRGVEVALGRPLKKGSFTQVDTPASMEGITKVIKTMFGKDVVFFRNNIPHIIAFNGMAPRHNKTTIYLNVDSVNPLVRVAGHELLHLLRREHKDIYNRLYRMALDEFNPEQVAAFTKKLDGDRQRNKQTGKTTEDLVHEEMLANFIGDNFARPEFWNALYKQSPSLMQKLAMLVRNFVTSVLKAANLRGFGSERYFNDLERMREAAVNALSEYSQKKGAGVGEETEAEFALAGRSRSDLEKQWLDLGSDVAFMEKLIRNPEVYLLDEKRHAPSPDGQYKVRMKGLGGEERTGTIEDVKAWYVEAVMRRNNIEAQLYGSGAEFSLAETFNTETIAKITGDSGRDYSPAQQDAFKRVGREIEIPPLKERVKHLWTDAGKKLAQGLVDQFAPVKEISQEAYTLLRLSKGASGAFEVFLKGGKLKLSDGVYDYDDTQKGGVIERLLIPLQAENDDFMWWVAANRAEQLSREDREHLFSEDDIAALKALDSGTTEFDYTIQHGAKAGQVTRDRTLIYRDALITFNEFNRNALDMAEQSDLIDGESRQYWEKEFYVPFYRVDEEEGLRGMNIKSGVVRQQAFKQLKGGRQKLNADLLENTLLNWAHLLDAAAKNRAAKATLEAAERVGVAHRAEWGDKKTVWHMGVTTDKEGKRRFGKVEYKVDDPYIMTAVSALEYAGMKGPLMDAMSQFKHWLTIGVTASPFFKIRNLIRDSVHAIGTSPLSYNIPGNVAKGFALTHPESDSYFRLLAGGGTIHFGTMLEGSESRRVRALVEAGVDKSTILDNEGKLKAFYKRMIEPAITAYNELGNRGEAINRASLYDQLIRQGKSHSEASLLARDLMDFSMGGAWTGIRFLTQTVPFLNARMQGLYKLGRSTKDDPRKLGIVLGATALFSIALMLAYEDDDDWKKREDWDRDSYWWFKIGGTAFRIPKPFEIGAMASLAERGVELFASDEMTGERFRKRLYHLLSDNLSLNPVPQLVKPVLDVYANKDSFTGRPIETMGMERMRPEYRMRASTSMAARGISTAGNVLTGDNFLSPVQVDHLFRGYFGWLGSFVVGSADKIARPATGQISRPAPDYWKVATGGLVAEKESASSRYVTQMYEQAKEIEQAYGTWRMLLKSGKAEEAREFKEENIDLLKKYHPSQRIKRQESKLNERIRLIERSNKAPDEKRRMILDLQRQKDLLARRLSA